jgi:hypothetical protein
MQGWSWPRAAEDGPLLAQSQVLQDQLTAGQPQQEEETAESVKQFHAVARTVRATDRRQQSLGRRMIFAPSARWWKAKRSPVGLRKRAEGENGGVVRVAPADAVEGITDSRGMLIPGLEVWAHGKDHNPLNTRRERASSISVTPGQQTGREPAVHPGSRMDASAFMQAR